MYPVSQSVSVPTLSYHETVTVGRGGYFGQAMYSHLSTTEIRNGNILEVSVFPRHHWQNITLKKNGIPKQDIVKIITATTTLDYCMYVELGIVCSVFERDI